MTQPCTLAGCVDMDLFVIVITFFAVGTLVRRWPAFRFTASLKTPAGGVLRDAELGYAQIRLPPRWRPAASLNEQACLQALDPLRQRYMIVISQSREDFVDTMDVSTHASETLAALSASLRVLWQGAPEHVEVCGFPAVQYELEGFHEATCVKYLHTTIAGDRAFHQIVIWATCSMYDRRVFEQVLHGFAELPGPPPRPRRMPPPAIQVTPRSRHKVH